MWHKNQVSPSTYGNLILALASFTSGSNGGIPALKAGYGSLFDKESSESNLITWNRTNAQSSLI